MHKAKEKPEKALARIKAEVVKEVLAEIGPLKKFPQDFLSEKTKKEMAVPILYPDLKLGFKISGREHRIRRAKISGKKLMAVQDLVSQFERKSTSTYEEILVPDGKLKIGDMKRTVQVCLENGAVILELSSLEKAKYVIYSRKKGQYVYKVPKSETVVKRAVAAYEKYSGEIRDKLIKAFIERKADKEAANCLAWQVLEELGL